MHLRTVMEGSLRHQGRSRPRRWIEGTWLLLGGPACLSGGADMADAQAFLDLVDKLDTGGRFTPEQLAQEIVRLYAAPDPLADGSLQFMTLHKAKGLEFDTVILPGLDRSTGGNDQALMLWEDVLLDGLDERLVAAPLKRRRIVEASLPTPYDYLAGLERRRSANEAARVLYVGATRAVRRLHLVGVAERNAKGEIHPRAGSFLDLLWPTVGSDFIAAAEALGDAAAADDTDFVAPLLRLVTPLPRGVVCPTGEVVPAVPAVVDDAADPFAASVGILVHAYLEMIAGDGVDAWPTQRIARLRPAMEVWFGQRGHGDRDAALGSARAQAMLATTLASDDGRWLLDRHQHDSAELALARAEAEGASLHIVDRSFIEDGVRWIIDYKTAVIEGDAAVHAERYRPQLARYAGLFRDDGRPLRLGVFYTALGRLIELH
jgi:ATP-dependent exoDNAse (exonuclease V) beta subunit